MVGERGSTGSRPRKCPKGRPRSRGTHCPFTCSGAPSELAAGFRAHYGPTTTAFDAAASARESELQAEVEALPNGQHASPRSDATSIPGAFLRVTVAR
jgi:hypothetical protein